MFRLMDASVRVEWSVKDGDTIRSGDIFGRVRYCTACIVEDLLQKAFLCYLI